MDFRLLGRLEVEADGVDLTPTRPKHRALLALLLLRADQIVSVDDLVEALWGEQPPDTARTALHGHISALRQRLGAERIETRPPGYRLRLADGDELDLRRFERIAAEARDESPAGRAEKLRDALDLFRGEPLADISLDGFASRETARIEELRLAALEQQIEADLELGRHVEAVLQLERLIPNYPLRERLRAQLMLALYRAGRQADALHVSQEARRVLAAELGIDPSPALQRLEHQILNQDPQLAAPDFFAPSRSRPVARPVGIVTFLFSQVDGSTHPLDQQGDDATAMNEQHRELLRSVADRHGGFEVEAGGGSILVAFARARDAAAAASGVQRAARRVDIRIRIGIHSAEAIATADGYIGPGVDGAARICAVAHAGQVLLSRTTRDLLRETPLDEVDVRDLGEHRLTDLGRAQRLFQLVASGLEREFPPVRSLDTRSTNLPVQPTPLIGREREIREVTDLLREPDVRLLALTGAGGSGKTRLGLQVAADLLDDFADGVFFVSLSPLVDADLVVTTIAAALGLRETGDETPADALRRHLRGLHCLLVLDNFEHVLAAAPSVADVIATAEGVKVLVTSRSPLRLADEQDYLVLPLATPHASDDVARLLQVESVALFASRARAARPEFAVTAKNAAAVAGICLALDGLPLAIELAASRIGVLPPAVLLQRLDRRLQLLTAGARDAPERHRALQTAIDWSYDLLELEEQRLFGRLAVFVGGCTLDAAEAVCSGDLNVLNGLGALIDQSLVRLEGTDEAPRFAMLETIREFAAARLDASGEVEELRRRHADHFLALAEEAETHLRGSPGEWPDRLEHEHDNLRAALDRLDAAGGRQHALQLAGALWRFWYLKGHLTEGRSRLESALRLDQSPTAARGKALIGAAVMAVNGGDAATARMRAEEGLALHRSLGDAWGAAYCQFMLGAAVGSDADRAAALGLYEESIRAFRELGDEHSALLASRNLAATYQAIGDFERARALYEDNLRRARATSNERIEASTLGALATIAFDEGRVQDAIWMLKESLRIHRDLGDRLDTAVGGLLTFGVTGIGTLVVAWLTGRHPAFPRALGYLGYLAGSLLVAIYLGRLLIVTATDPLVAGPAILTGFLVAPAWYLWLGVVLRRAGALQ